MLWVLDQSETFSTATPEKSCTSGKFYFLNWDFLGGQNNVQEFNKDPDPCAGNAACSLKRLSIYAKPVPSDINL